MILMLPFLLYSSANAQAFQKEPKVASGAKKWIFNDQGNKVIGLGIADYSPYNPKKSWDKAFEYALQDLNANHSLMVYHSGYQVGQGPLRTSSNYAIRNLLDSTQVAIVDSARWEGQAFLLVEPKSAVPDSMIYPERDFKTVHDSVTTNAANSARAGQWLHTTGSANKISSNWNMSITKAKQKALRNLAEHLATRISTKTYAINERQRRYLEFSTIFAFQRIRTVNRSFEADSFRVELAIHPSEVKMLLED